MATALEKNRPNVDISSLFGEFNLDTVPVYNLVNVGG